MAVELVNQKKLAWNGLSQLRWTKAMARIYAGRRLDVSKSGLSRMNQGPAFNQWTLQCSAGNANPSSVQSGLTANFPLAFQRTDPSPTTSKGPHSAG